MNKFLLGVLVVVAPLFLLGTLTKVSGNFSVGGCKVVATTEQGDESYETMSGKDAKFCFEPDTGGAGSTGVMGLYQCVGIQAATGCEDYDFDSDFDNVPDTNLVDGDSPGQRCVPIRNITGYLRIYTETAPAADEEAVWELCGTDQ